MRLVPPWQEPICGMQIVLQELGKDAQRCSDTSLLAAWLCMSFAFMFHQEMCISLWIYALSWNKEKYLRFSSKADSSWSRACAIVPVMPWDLLEILRFLFATFWFCVFHHVFLTATLGTSRNCPTSRHARYGGWQGANAGLVAGSLVKWCI